MAHWKFDESSGGIAHDSIGGIDGTLSVSGANFVPGGISGNALALNRAANGFARMGNVFDFSGQDFSLVAWIKMNVGDTTESSVIVGKQAAGTTNGYWMGVNESGGGGRINKALFYAGRGSQQAPVSAT